MKLVLFSEQFFSYKYMETWKAHGKQIKLYLITSHESSRHFAMSQQSCYYKEILQLDVLRKELKQMKYPCIMLELVEVIASCIYFLVRKQWFLQICLLLELLLIPFWLLSCPVSVLLEILESFVT